MLGLCFGVIALAAAIAIVRLLSAAARSGRILRPFGRSAGAVDRRSAPVAFVLRFAGWCAALVLVTVTSGAFVRTATLADFLVLPSFLGPLAALVLTTRRRGQPAPTGFVDDVGAALERADPDAAERAVQCLLPGVERRVSASAVDALKSQRSAAGYRDGGSHVGLRAPLDAARRAERVRLAVCAVPIGLTVAPWLAPGLFSEPGDMLTRFLFLVVAVGLTVAVVVQVVRADAVARATADALTARAGLRAG